MTAAVPRLLIGGTHSSAGKTTVTLGLLAAFRAQGVRAAPFKAGPDYIDPSLHSQVAGQPARNLDSWLLDAAALRGVLGRGMLQADLALVEGVMGLFDGIGSSQDGSTAALARALDCPVALVLDAAAMSGTAAAIVLGCQQLRPGVRLVGVILNRVGSEGHLASTREAILNATGLPVLGSLPNEPRLSLPERHLGLVPATERALAPEMIDRLAQLVRERFDLPALRRLAESAPPLATDGDPLLPRPVPGRPRIAVARDRAFGFYYQDSIDLLAACGAEIVPFSPLADAQLPEHTLGAYLGGGFPELFAAELSANQPMRQALREHAALGRPIYAECGGLMALGESLRTFEGETHALFGLLPFQSRMERERLTLGYRELEAVRDSPLMPAGSRVRGHEFHWSVADPPPPELAAYRVVGADRLEGFRRGSTLASYVHLNLAARPELARRFVAACATPVKGQLT